MYQIKKIKKGFVIEREDGSICNEWVFGTEKQAKKYLELLIAMGYCK